MSKSRRFRAMKNNGNSGGYAMVALAYAILVFLLAPTVVIACMSVGTDRFLSFPPTGFTLQWYADFFVDPDWRNSALLSLEAAILTSIGSVIVGTMLALAIVRGRLPFRGAFDFLVIGPIIVPHIALAVALLLIFQPYGLTGTTLGFSVAHMVLALPFVVFTILAALYRYDPDLERAALSCGASPLRAFLTVTLPSIRTGVLSAALLAFVTSFDEPIVSFFISSYDSKTLPRKMFEDIDYNISPTLAAVATMLSIFTIFLLAIGFLCRRVLMKTETKPI